MEEKNQHLLKPLIIHPKSDHCNIISSNTSTVLRLVIVIFAGVVSLWANNEASKGFAITIVNEADDTFQGKRFDLFYVSNDEATRLLLKTSKFVQDFLYPSHDHDIGKPQIKKQVKHVILRLSSRNLTRPVIVESGYNDHEYVLHICPSVLESPNFKHDMFLTVQKGMGHVWLWDGEGKYVPASLVNGMTEYMTSLATSPVEPPVELGGRVSCWKSKDPMTIAKLLSYWDGRSKGFVRRLNQAMRNGWHEKMIDDALGIPAWHLCQPFINSREKV